MMKNNFLLSLLYGELLLLGGAGFLLNNKPTLLHQYLFYGVMLLPILAFIGISIINFVPSETIKKLVRFGMVGVLNTAIDFGVLNFLLYYFQIAGGIHLIYANTVSFAFAVTNSYFWNKYWTFEQKTQAKVAEFTEFLVVSLVALGLNDGVVYFLTNYLKPSAVSTKLWINMAKIAATLAAFSWNFIGYKLIVFREKEEGRNR